MGRGNDAPAHPASAVLPRLIREQREAVLVQHPVDQLKLARAYANVGQPHEAARLAWQTLGDSTSLQSLSAQSELRRAVPVLQRWRQRAEVADVLHRLQGDSPTNA